MKWSFVFAGFLIFSASRALADWYEVIPNKVDAEKADDLNVNSGKIAEYCVPCGDAKPTFTIIDAAHNANVLVTPFKGGGWCVSVNGKPLDLAYTYVKTPHADLYSNVAAQLGYSLTSPYEDPAAAAAAGYNIKQPQYTEHPQPKRITEAQFEHDHRVTKNLRSEKLGLDATAGSDADQGSHPSGVVPAVP